MGQNAHRASSEDAGGLDPVIHLTTTARVMLTDRSRRALGTVVSICCEHGGPPDLPLAVMVRFDSYSGPDHTVPIIPI